MVAAAQVLLVFVLLLVELIDVVSVDAVIITEAAEMAALVVLNFIGIGWELVQSQQSLVCRFPPILFFLIISWTFSFLFFLCRKLV